MFGILVRLPRTPGDTPVVREDAPSRVVHRVIVQQVGMDSGIDLKGIRALALPAMASTVTPGDAAVDDSVGAEGQVVVRPWRLENVELPA